MRYKGQFHEVEVPIFPNEFTGENFGEVIERFHNRHEDLYGYKDEQITEIINLRLSAFGKTMAPSRKKYDFETEMAENCLKGQRRAHMGKNGKSILVSVYDGDRMTVGNSIRGPAIIEQTNTTIVVPGYTSLEVTSTLDYLIQIKDEDWGSEKNER
jgi:N-methylhydantoinase A